MACEVTIQPLGLSASPPLVQPEPVSVPAPSILLYSKLGSAAGQYPSDQAIIDAIDDFLQPQMSDFAVGGTAGENAVGNGVGDQRKTDNSAQAGIVRKPTAVCCPVQ